MTERVFSIVKRGARVKAKLRGGANGQFNFYEAKSYDTIDSERVFAVDSESFTSDGKLRTLLSTIRWHDESVKIETPNGKGMLDKLCEQMIERFGVPQTRPSNTVQRPRKFRRGSSRARDGRRKTIRPILSVWFNLAYDFGRLAADLPNVLRSVLAGADSYRVKISDRHEIEIVRMHFGSSSSFEWYVRDQKAKLIVRVVGIDLTGYWKTSLSNAAKSLGVAEKVDIEKMFGQKPEEFFRRDRDSFTPEEWDLFANEYALGDVQTTLELYHRTVALLREIDERVVRKSGIVPPSAPGAAARIVFAGAFDQHPELKKEEGGPGFWPRPPQWVDQMGCESYYGGRVFSSLPGIHKRMITLDIKSAYPYAMACLPDPVTAIYRYVLPREEFDLDFWKGRWGVLYIDGEGLDDIHPALREHDHENRRLRYLVGKFENHAATIPEIVMGVISGSLRVDRIRRGVVMQGSAEKSFFRSGMQKFFEIKNNPELEKALQDMAKLLANATYGKLVEVNGTDYSVGEQIPMPRFKKGEFVANTIARIFAENGPAELSDTDYAGETEEEAEKVRFMYEKAGRIEGDLRSTDAVIRYIEALTYAGVEAHRDEFVTIGDFMRSNKRYRCGQYFMPLCAALVTGLTSATVGLLARCLNAWQGDTDSVHLQLPEGMTCKKNQRAEELGLPGFERFQELLKAAGYGEDIPGVPDLGKWFCESPGPSKESVLVRPKLYSHLFEDGSIKQAKHGFTKWPKKKTGLHKALAFFWKRKEVCYRTKPAPRKLREAVLTGKEVGEFLSGPVKLVLAPDPNTWTDANGIVRWLGREKRLKEAA